MDIGGYETVVTVILGVIVFIVAITSVAMPTVNNATVSPLNSSTNSSTQNNITNVLALDHNFTLPALSTDPVGNAYATFTYQNSTTYPNLTLLVNGNSAGNTTSCVSPCTITFVQSYLTQKTVNELRFNTTDVIATGMGYNVTTTTLYYYTPATTESWNASATALYILVSVSIIVAAILFILASFGILKM